MGRYIRARMGPRPWAGHGKSMSYERRSMGDKKGPVGDRKTPVGKQKYPKTYLKVDKRDVTLLIILLRHRIIPPVPYIIITDIILNMSPDSYQDLCQKNCQWEGLNEEEQYYWFCWWCKGIEKKEVMRGGGRWVAAVNWESERIQRLHDGLRDQLEGRGLVFEIVDQEGVDRLKWQVGQKKQFIKLNKALKEKEEFIRAEEDKSTLQADWYHKNDWRYGSVPDLTILKPKSVVGQGYPFNDFLRPEDEDPWSWNFNSDTASRLSANSTYSSSSSLTAWSDSSTVTSSTMPLWNTSEVDKNFKTIDAYNATQKFDKAIDYKKAMHNKLNELNLAEREGTLVNDWMMTDSSVEVC
ncbi:0a9491ff-3f26-4c8e-b693-4746bcbb8cff [Sclerotinia trifoliorum]|uniref:0a9491ff-3f26-4c8e-b693-4746bcbb8cff n=1 Tax=Sclerotinia trifoliorum TaxID=28548 RepID=A0A8H2VU81_9HELO|nr:0a9491ff-3f26-4c8e-b693-4746bcbb8cff [Sclerotinia trifoliorum]